MRPLIDGLRSLRGQNPRRDTNTPVPLTGRYATTGVSGSLTPAGAEAQLRAVGANGTLFAVVDAYATAVASVAWHMYRQLPPGAPEGTEQQKVPGHPALWLWNNPNNFFSRPRLVKTVQQHIELLGEGIVVVAKVGSLPVELWPAAPHKMEPVRHPTKYLVGWIYHADDGERVPLGVDQVIQIVRNPCPWDPYRGMGAVQSILTNLYSTADAERWQQRFFRNSARPGGVVKVPNSLSDTEFEEFRDRWRDAHQGVDNAGRVAILENGAEWQDVSYSMHDMQFVELQEANHEHVRGAYRMPKTILGEGESLNRATAEAQLFMFSSGQAVPRLNDWRDDMLNFRLLPMYGTTGAGNEFGYVNPTPEDKEAKDRNMVAQATAYGAYVAAGVDPDDEAMLRHLSLPAMRTVPRPEPAPEPVPNGNGSGSRKKLSAAHTANGHHHVQLAFGREPRRPALPRAAADDDGDEEDAPDLSGVLTDLHEALKRLQANFAPVDQAWFDAVAEQVREAVEAGDREALAAMTLDTAAAVDLVAAALALMEATAAERAARETAVRGVRVEPGEPTEEEEDDDAGLAEFAAALIAGWLLAAAAKEALRLWLASEPVVAGVLLFLGALKHVARWAFLAWLLHRATNRGRYWTFRVAVEARPGAVAYASEVNDRNRCGPCRDFDGHRFASLDEAFTMYGGGGYPLCEGRERCRGTYRMVWPE